MFRTVHFTTSVVCSIVVHAAAGQTVVLRAGEEVREGEAVTALSESGVVLSSAGGVREVSLDRVASVSGEPWADEWAALAEPAAMLWRARSRIERGDLASAEPLLESLIPTLGQRGESAAIVWTGLLRCRLASGRVPASIEAFIRYSELRKTAGTEAAMFRNASALPVTAIVDEESMLCPGLAPIFVGTPGVIALARSGGRIGVAGAGDHEAPSSLAVLFALALKAEAGSVSGEVLPSVTRDGEVLVRDIVKSRIGSADERTSARAALRDRLSQAQPGWVCAWCHTAIGRSLLLETDIDSRLLGVAQLLRVPASYATDAPYLTGICLAESAVALAELGDTASAQSLRSEFAASLPDHPVLDWPKLRAIGTENGVPAAAARTILPSGEPR